MERRVCIILAGGRGTRMRSQTTHKVCFPIAGKPAILRSIEAYKAAGLNSIHIVVGALAGQVVETVGAEHPDATFVYQAEPRGTGHATRVGVTPLKQMGFDGLIVVTMGDKLISVDAVRQLLAAQEEGDLDVAVGVIPREDDSSGGRILLHPDGRFAGIVETRDIQKAAILEEAHRILAQGAREGAAALDAISEMASAVIADPKKRAVALGPFGQALEARDMEAVLRSLDTMGESVRYISLGKSRFTPAEANESAYQNAAFYVFRAEALYESLRWISADNAQNEEYLTDAVNYLANTQTVDGRPAYRVSHCVLPPEEILTYNDPEELLKVEEAFQRRQSARVAGRPDREEQLAPSRYRPVREWLALLEARGPELRSTLRTLYGDNESLWKERIASFKSALERFGELHGYDRKVILVRAPGRINLMGRHIEHRGGCVNVMAINKETVLVAAPREDDVVRIHNIEPEQYPDSEFRIGDEIAGLPWDGWLSFINHERVQRLVTESRGNWVNYVKAAFLRLQMQEQQVRLRGMDAVFAGNIPVAAGLSSSSAIVVASAEAAIALNGLKVISQDFVDLCGEGEWYVGSRGGAGDHAAIKFSRRGEVTQIGFFPFSLKGSVPFPEGYRLVIVNSHIKANKTTNAKDTFNQRVASYEFGLMLLKERYPALAGKMQRLRDVNPRTLGVRPSEIYSMLLSLPERLTPEQVRRELGAAYKLELERIFSSHELPDYYLIRSVVLYGIAECARAEKCRSLLEQGDMEALGRMMLISHNGDRVVRYSGWGSLWRQEAYDYSASDGYLRSLIADLQSEESTRVTGAQLAMQPGGYACSTPEIDEIVDLSITVPGVLGAQLSGAGLGGCAMVLAREEAVAELSRTLIERFYGPRGMEPALTVTVPVRGSGLFDTGY